MQVLERSWFAGKRCLDVGCNEGVVSLSVAVEFGTASMRGIDIDEPLIQMACRSLERERATRTEQLVAVRRAGRPQAAVARLAATATRALKGVRFQAVSVQLTLNLWEGIILRNLHAFPAELWISSTDDSARLQLNWSGGSSRYVRESEGSHTILLFVNKFRHTGCSHFAVLAMLAP